MGNLHQLPIRQWREQYGLLALGETGTWEGAAVLAALEAGYSVVTTVDVCPLDYAQRVVQESGLLGTVFWHVGDSVDTLPLMLREVGARPTLWWLDAHLPERYAAPEGTPRTPLLAEVNSIVQADRDHSRDVFVCDDMRLYGRPCQDGPMPLHIPAGDRQDLVAIQGLLSVTHFLHIDDRSTGYLVGLPVDKC
jgi:hypothetical protein